MFKKILTLVLVLTLTISIFTFVGCGKDGGDDEPTAITLENGLTVENGVVTAYTPNLEVVIPETYKDSPVTKIGSNAFKGESYLKSVVIPNTITSIDDNAFADCGPLTIYCKAKSKPDGWSSSWNSSNCSVVWNSNGPSENSNMVKLENCLTIDAGVVKSYAPTSESSVILDIPEKVEDMYITEIAGEVFRNCKVIKRLKMPKTISKVGKLAFNGCSNLEIVECQSVASWCGITFNDVYSNPMTQSKTKQLYVNGAALTELVIPETVYSIGQYAFYTLSGLTRVVVGSNVAFIGKSALFVANGMALEEFKFMNTKGWVNAGTGGTISSSFKPVHKGQSNASHAYTYAWPAYTTWGLNADWKRV